MRRFSSSPAWRLMQNLTSKSRPQPACCHIASPHPLIVPPTHPLVVPAGCCVASRCSALSLSCCLVVPPLAVSSRQLVVASSSLVVLSLHHPLSCPLIVLRTMTARGSRSRGGKATAMGSTMTGGRTTARCSGVMGGQPHILKMKGKYREKVYYFP